MGQHYRDVHGKTKLVKEQRTLSFPSFPGSKCKKYRDDNYDGSEETQMDINGATQKQLSVPEKKFLRKRPKEENVTAVCSSWYITTKSCSNVSSTIDRKLNFMLRFEINRGSWFLRTRTSSRKQESKRIVLSISVQCWHLWCGRRLLWYGWVLKLSEQWVGPGKFWCHFCTCQ